MYSVHLYLVAKSDIKCWIVNNNEQTQALVLTLLKNLSGIFAVNLPSICLGPDPRTSSNTNSKTSL